MASGLLWWIPLGEVPEVGAALLAQELRRGVPPQILDVRTAAEWKSSRIEGSVNVPVTELKSRLDALGLDPGRPVVAICRSAHRSIPAVRLLRGRGFRDVRQLAGGMKAWWAADLPVEKG